MTSSIPRRRLLVSWLSLLGLGSLCYSLGAAVIFFDLPSGNFLRRAFVGGAGLVPARAIFLDRFQSDSRW